MPINSLNDGQYEAVVTRGCSILVSAPAGSGKTKILVNRIMALIEDDGYNVDQLLVLTFTNAAALEMKQRLQVALDERLQEDINKPLEQHLLKQKQLLPKAYITNFHGFCSTLLKQYGYLINLNSNLIFALILHSSNTKFSITVLKHGQKIKHLLILSVLIFQNTILTALRTLFSNLKI